MAITEERREVAGFDRIALAYTGEMIIDQGDQDSLVIEADTDLLPKLKSEVRDGQLELGLKHWYDALFMMAARPVRYHITVRSLRGISISGAGSATVSAIQTNEMKIRISGSGNISMPELRADRLDISISGTAKARMGGSAQVESVQVSGSGALDSAELVSQAVTIHISGTCSARVDAEESLEVHISGSGDVGYRGKPSLRQHISGVGRIHPL